MAGTTTVTILTPEKPVFSGQVEFVVLPGSEGELGMLPGHMALVTPLKAGKVRCTAGGATRVFLVESGYARIDAGSVTVLTTSARAG